MNKIAICTRICSVLFAVHISLSAYSQTELLTIKAKEVDGEDYTRSTTLQEYHDGEKWGWHSGGLGSTITSSDLIASKGISYSASNLHDLDLRTAWVEGVENYGIGEFIEIEFIASYPNHVKDFNYQIEVFNGYCKSEELWEANSRVKTFKVYFNDKPIGLVELVDTWQQQSFDIRDFYPDQPQVFTAGDTLKFEILAVYKGSKYKDVAISEFVTPSFAGG